MDETEHSQRPIRRWLCTCNGRWPCAAHLDDRIPGGRIPDGQTQTWRGISIRVAGRA